MADTARLTIRRFTADNWRDLYEYLSDPAVVKYEPYGVYTEAACQQEAARRAADDIFWAVALRETGKVIGNITLSKQECGTWELGYVFNTAYQGQGYATESAGAAVSYAFTQLGAHRVTAMCNPSNTKSWKLLERLPMRREGHLKQNVYFITDSDNRPVWTDTYLYAILSTEWQAQSGQRGEKQKR